MKHADIVSIAIEQFHRQHEMFSFVGVGNEQRFGRTVLLAIVQVQLLHVLIRIADADKRAQLGSLLRFAVAMHFLLSVAPAVAKQVNTRWRTEETFLITIWFLSNLQKSKKIERYFVNLFEKSFYLFKLKFEFLSGIGRFDINFEAAYESIRSNAPQET